VEILDDDDDEEDRLSAAKKVKKEAIENKTKKRITSLNDILVPSSNKITPMTIEEEESLHPIEEDDTNSTQISKKWGKRKLK